MVVDTFCDLNEAWHGSTTLGKIFYFWLIFLSCLGLLAFSLILGGIVKLGQFIGFIRQ